MTAPPWHEEPALPPKQCSAVVPLPTCAGKHSRQAHPVPEQGMDVSPGSLAGAAAENAPCPHPALAGDCCLQARAFPSLLRSPLQVTGTGSSASLGLLMARSWPRGARTGRCVSVLCSVKCLFQEHGQGETTRHGAGDIPPARSKNRPFQHAVNTASHSSRLLCNLIAAFSLLPPLALLP